MALAVFAVATHAQPVVEVAPTPVLFGNRPGAENYTQIRNVGTEPLRVDSLGFLVSKPHGWIVNLALQDITYALDYAFGGLTSPSSFPRVVLEPLDTATVHFVAWDACLVCKTAESSIQLLDTLFVITNDATRSVVETPIDFTFYVGVEGSDATSPVALTVFPTPAKSVINVRFQSTVAYVRQLVITDVLGRQLYRQAGAFAAHNQFAIPLRSARGRFPPGLYVLTVQTGVTSHSRAFTIVD